MPNLAQALKQEIARVARKQLRIEIQPLKTANARYRSQIAALTKQVATMERQVKRSTKANGRNIEAADTGNEPERQIRFSPTRLAAQRKRLGLSAREFGQLIGVSALSVYKWEKGETRPRAKQLEAIASVRGVGKREVAARLAET